MKKRQSFLKGVFLLTMAGILVKLIGFAYRVVLTNLPGYGDEGNGIYGAGYQVYLILFVLSTTGFPAAISRLVAEKMAVGDWRGAHKIFKVSFWLLCSIGTASSILFFISSKYIAQLISNPRTVYTMLALSPTIFFVSLMAVFRGYFQGMQDMTPQAGSQIIEQLAKTVFTIILAHALLPYGVEIAAAGATLGTTIGAAIGVIYLWGLYNRRKAKLWQNIRNFYVRKKSESAYAIVKKLIKLSVPISLGAAVLTIGNLIDLGTVMNQLSTAGFDNKAANELYGVLTGKCYVLTHFPTAINVALATSLVPAIAGAMAVRNYKAASAKAAMSLKLTVIIGLPASVGMAVLAEPILKLLFPGASGGGYLLAISSFTIVFVGLTQTLSGILQGLGRVVIPAVSLFAGAVIKLAINFTLVPMPHINIKGAVYGTLACYIVASLINFIALKKNFKLNLGVGNFIIKPLVATIVMAIAAYTTYHWVFGLKGSNTLSTGASIVIGAAVYGVLLILMGGIDSREISVLPFGKNINYILGKIKLIRS